MGELAEWLGRQRGAKKLSMRRSYEGVECPIRRRVPGNHQPTKKIPSDQDVTERPGGSEFQEGVLYI